MASVCTTCNESILTTEFVQCEGICNKLFHSKCVALNKTTLNAITGNPNVHWYCYTCNDARIDVSSSIDNLKQSVDQLTCSLASDLSKFTSGFKLLSDTLVGNISSLRKGATCTKPNVDANIGKKRQRDESNEDAVPMPRKKIILGSNRNHESIAAINISEPSGNVSKSERRKSVVVSNIACGISAEYLTNYLSSELAIDNELIRVTSLNSNSNKVNAIQYRVSVPELHYNKLMSSNTWPQNVRVRDYVFKRRNNTNNGVSMNNFLERQTANRTETPILPVETQTIPDSEILPLENATESIEIEMGQKD